MSGDYFIGVHDRELERLRQQHQAWRAETEALWNDAGFGAGQHIADLGSGPGFAAMDLANRVGKVSAVDKASHFLEFLRGRDIANVATVRADLTRDALEGPFDGAFCRWFLAFLIADLDQVLRTIHRSLKPGGVLAAMEYLSVESTTSSPPLRGLDAHTRGWIELYRKNGGDTSIGRTLPQKLSEAGFHIRSLRCVGGLSFAGEPRWNWWGRLIEDFGQKLVDERCMAHEDLQALKEDWALASRQKQAFIHTPILLQVVAGKP